MDFWRLVSVIGKRKWLILLSVAVTVVLTIGASRLMGSKWIATVRFVATDNSVLTSATPGAEAAREESQVEAEHKAVVYTSVVRSKEVVEPVLKQLNITHLPDDFLDSFKFEAATPKVFELQLTDTDKDRAREVVNALADSFLAQYQRIATRNARDVLVVLERELTERDVKLREARQAYDAFCARNKIVATATGAVNYAREDLITRLRTAKQTRDTVQDTVAAARARLQARLSEPSAPPVIGVSELPNRTPGPAVPAPQTTPPPVAAPATNPEVRALEERLAVLSQSYTPVHPAVREATARLESLKAQLIAQAATQAQNQPPAAQQPAAQQPATPPAIAQAMPMVPLAVLRSELAGYEAQLNQLNGNIARMEAETARFRGIDGPAAELQGRVVEMSEARAGLASRVNLARAALDVSSRSTPVALAAKVDPYNPVQNQSAGRTKKLLLLGVFCALLGTSGLVVAFDAVDRRLRNVSEAQAALPSNVIAAIPQPMGAISYSDMALVTSKHPQSLQAEAYRFLAQHLLSDGSRARSLMAVSMKAHQGTTTTLTNLAVSLAQAGKKVILVDANVRTAELHQVFHTENEFGLMDLLENPSAEALEEALQPTEVPNLEVITTGVMRGNPWELFRSSSLSQVAGKLLDRADYVLYDTPSAVMFTDAYNLAPVVDGAFLCVRALEELTGAEKRVISRLEQSNVDVLGCVLTDVPPAVLDGFDNYRHYYAKAIGSTQVVEEPAEARTGAIPMIDLPSNQDS